MESWKVVSDSTRQQDSRRKQRQARIPGKDQATKVPRNRRNLERTGAHCAIHSIADWGTWRQRVWMHIKLGQWDGRSLYRWKSLIILSVRGQPALLLTAGGSTEPLLSSNASVQVTSWLWDKSYILSFRKTLALIDCFFPRFVLSFQDEWYQEAIKIRKKFQSNIFSPLSHIFISILQCFIMCKTY